MCETFVFKWWDALDTGTLKQCYDWSQVPPYTLAIEHCRIHHIAPVTRRAVQVHRLGEGV